MSLAPCVASRGNTGGKYSCRSSSVQVSIRPRPRGQGKRPAAPGTVGSSTSFNPPPATRPGETPVVPARASAHARFQSAPGHEARGNAAIAMPMVTRALFQSAPGHEARGNVRRGLRRSAVIAVFQSAPGHEARGNTVHAASSCGDRPSFNPPPATRPGETRDRGPTRQLPAAVSIRPRPRGQGKHV